MSVASSETPDQKYELSERLLTLLRISISTRSHRESYLLEESYKSLVEDILRLRDSMLPASCIAFKEMRD
ncbi:hypothetical protein BDR06DRAFT_954506 [Suillus hirtellus]|nr:hypothetical protein BDR06DRAFT_954506 [Suillus hirtellus]